MADITVMFSAGIGSTVTPAVEWTAALLVCSALYSLLITTVFRRRNRQKATDVSRLFWALYLAAFSGASVLIVDHAMALVAPLFVAPIPILFLLFFYIFPGGAFAPRWARWLGIILAISFAASFAPSQQSPQSANAAQIFASHVPGLLGAVATVRDVVSLLAILVGIVPQLYYRYLHYSVTGERTPPAVKARPPWEIALIPASFVVLIGSQLLAGAPPKGSGALLSVTSALFLVLALCPIAGGYILLERRPYDWEALSNRLLIYGLLTFCQAVIYVASIVALLFLFPGFSSLPPYGYIPFFVLVGLLLATTRSMLRAVAAQPAASPGDVLAQVNVLLSADLPASMFVTCFYAILDPATGHLQYANAGQDLPYLRQADGATSELRATGMPLGLMPGSRYEECEARLSPGCRLLFYSDGLVEAHNPEREMFGFHRLSGLFGHYERTASPISYLLDELATFTGDGWEQEDDITLVTLQWEQPA